MRVYCVATVGYNSNIESMLHGYREGDEITFVWNDSCALTEDLRQECERLFEECNIGEAPNWINRHYASEGRVTHTSMSVGDVIVFERVVLEDDCEAEVTHIQTYACDRVGWKVIGEIPSENVR